MGDAPHTGPGTALNESTAPLEQNLGHDLFSSTTRKADERCTCPTMIAEFVSAVVIGTMLPLGVVALGLSPMSMVQPRSPTSDGRVCVVAPIQQQPSNNATGAGVVDDVPQILQAFADCNDGGTVVFLEGARYSIASRLNLVVKDVTVDWHGIWQVSTLPAQNGHERTPQVLICYGQFSTNRTYWRDNGYPIAFQNHQAGFILSGERIRINGHQTGGIDGGGNSWYEAEQGSTQAGRPMPFVLWNVSDVVVQHCKWSSRRRYKWPDFADHPTCLTD